MKAPKMTNAGFSLLEILIVTSIMGVIALLASNAIKNGLNNKTKMDARLRVESSVFDALRLMATDIERAFHHQYALYEIDKQAIAATPPPQCRAMPRLAADVVFLRAAPAPPGKT